MLVKINISPGELVDKITILQIKSERIIDSSKLKNINYELADLSKTFKDSVPQSAELDNLSAELKKVNEKLWGIEDDIRDCEREKDFGPKFVKLAQSVYMTNDRRFALKSAINKLLNAAIQEEKSYKEY
jgi:hypothetical protein